MLRITRSKLIRRSCIYFTNGKWDKLLSVITNDRKNKTRTQVIWLGFI